ncbi:hypothetical protein CMUS01_07626, partial [Colletotrichum musicola]
APTTTTLGLLLKIGAILSLLALATAGSFVSWLWWSPPDNERWRNWVLTPNRLQMSITVTGVISRTAISFLATLATAMIASVAIERRGVLLHTVARASIARSGVSGPLSLAQLALERSVETTVRALLAVLILTTMAAQLTWTILLTDLRQQPIVSHPRQIPNAHNLILSDLDPTEDDLKQLSVIDTSEAGHLVQRPLSSEIFAEYSEPGVQLEGVDDTGPTVRAFLPITQRETRETVHMFQGMARVFESRVMCIRPEILRLQLYQGEICGTVQLGSVDADSAGIGAGAKPLNFTCTIPNLSSDPLRRKENWQFCEIFHSNNQPIIWKLPSPLLGLTTNVILVWDGFTGQDYNGTDTDSTVEKVRADYTGPWLSTTYNIRNLSDYSFEKPGSDISFNMTLCLFSQCVSTSGSIQSGYLQGINFLNISASSAVNRTEPTYGWDKRTKSFDMESIRRQLGAVPHASSLGASGRGILSISQDSLKSSIDQAPNISIEAPHHVWREAAWLWEMVSPPGATIALCSQCRSREDNTVFRMDQVYAQLFNHTLEETKSPALAVQAVQFMLARSVYSYYQNSNGVSGNATIDNFDLMSLPGSFVGYWTVIGTFAAFVLAFAAIAVLFRATQCSLPDNAWHTVSQISESEELRRVTREVTVMSDNDVKRLVNETEKGKGLVGRAHSLLRESLSGFWSRDAGTWFSVRDSIFVRVSEVSEGRPSTPKKTESLETGRRA